MQRDRPSGFPTILVASEDRSIRQAFTSRLQQDRCLVISARNADEALQMVVSHSRAIHVLLIDLNMDGLGLAARLSCYRPHMQVVVFSEERDDTIGALPPEEATAKVRFLLGIDPSVGADKAVPIRKTTRSAEMENHKIRPMTPRIA